MGRAKTDLNGNVTLGYPSEELFSQTGSIAGSDFAVVSDNQPSRKVTFNPTSQGNGTKYIITSQAISSDITITLPATSGTLALGGGGTGTNFGVIQPDAGTSPTATVSGDTLTITNTDSAITISGNSTTNTLTLTITNNGITNAKLAQMAAHTFKGNNTGSTANALDLTATQLTAEINNFVGDSGSGGTKGLVVAPASGDASKFLRGDATWQSVSTSAITSLTGDVTASGPGAAAATLATVNSNVGSFGSSTSIPSVTVNAKGLVTAASGNVVVAPAGTLTGTTLASNVVTTSITSVGTQAAALNMGSHLINNVTDPSSAQDAATKNYVDNAINGLNWKAACRLASAAALPANTYNNGASGVGATLTGVSFGALSVDGTVVVVGDRILVKNEVAGANNGIYVVTTVGAVATLYVLTRTSDFDQAADISEGDTVFIEEGTVNSDTAWSLSTAGPFTVGTTSLAFVQVSGPGSIIAGTGITVSGNTVSLTNPVTVALGGTGLASGTSGGVPYYSGSTTIASSGALTASRIVLGGGAGASPTVLGSLGTTTTLLHGNASGAPTFAAVSLTADVSGQLPVANGGTGIASGTSGGVPYFSGTTTIASSAALAANQLVLGGGAGATPATLGSLGTTTQVLHGNAGGAPTFGSIVTADLPSNQTIGAIGLTLDGAGSAITTGIKGDLMVPYGATINSVTMLADQTGSIVIDIWKDTYANYPPTVADTITASALPTITSANKSQDTTLTGWTTSITAGDTIRFNVNSCSTITRCALILKVTYT